MTSAEVEAYRYHDSNHCVYKKTHSECCTEKIENKEACSSQVLSLYQDYHLVIESKYCDHRENFLGLTNRTFRKSSTSLAQHEGTNQAYYSPYLRSDDERPAPRKFGTNNGTHLAPL
jgi:hypothetical protein